MTPREILLHFVVFALFGIFVPWQKGLDFFDVLLLLPYSCLSFLFVAPAVIDGIFDSAGRRVSPAILARGLAYGWTSGFVILVLGITTVNLTSSAKRLVLPPTSVLLCCLLLSLLGSIFVAGLSAWIALRTHTSEKAKRTIRLAFLLLLCLVLFLPARLPSEWQEKLILNLTPAGIAQTTLLGAPLVTLVDILLLTRVVGKRNRWA